MKPVIFVDGQPAGALSARDRGLQFGDGLFETCAVTGGHIRLLPRHLARLATGAAALQIPLPTAAQLADELERIAAAVGHGVVKLIVTRGSGARGYAPPRHCRARRIVYCSAWPELPATLRLRVCRTPLASGGSLAGIKHLNRLEQVLARLEWTAGEQADDGLMLDPEGNVIETTSANLFIVRDGAVVTPSLDRCGVAGVMRELAMELLGPRCTARELSLAELTGADEVFVTNAVAAIRPVVELGSSDWQAGPVTAALAECVREYLAREPQ